MANHVYSSIYTGVGGGTSSYSSRSAATSAAVDPYLPSDPSYHHHHPYTTDRGGGSSSHLYTTDPIALRYTTSSSAADYARAAAVETPHLTPQAASWSAGVSADPSAGLKRPSDSLYHQTLLGAYNANGQSDTWYTTNPLVKRPRFETTTSSLPVYPQRPGEKDCAHYMLTRTCKFADSCRFDHPLWVPEGGIPDWKEGTLNF